MSEDAPIQGLADISDKRKQIQVETNIAKSKLYNLICRVMHRCICVIIMKPLFCINK